MYKKQIAKGVGWLNDNYPGWYNGVDVKRLEMSSCFNCVLGQLFGHYAFGKTKLPSEDNMCLAGIEHGFSVDLSNMMGLADIDAKILTKEWVKVIFDLRARIKIPKKQKVLTK